MNKSTILFKCFHNNFIITLPLLLPRGPFGSKQRQPKGKDHHRNRLHLNRCRKFSPLPSAAAKTNPRTRQGSIASASSPFVYMSLVLSLNDVGRSVGRRPHRKICHYLSYPSVCLSSSVSFTALSVLITTETHPQQKDPL